MGLEDGGDDLTSDVSPSRRGLVGNKGDGLDLNRLLRSAPTRSNPLQSALISDEGSMTITKILALGEIDDEGGKGYDNVGVEDEGRRRLKIATRGDLIPVKYSVGGKVEEWWNR